MFGGLVFVGEEAGAFVDDVGAGGGPREFGGVAFGGDGDAFAVDDEVVAFGGDVAVEAPVDGVVFEDEGEFLSAGEVVDADEFDVVGVDGGADDAATDATEAVDADFNSHKRDPWWRVMSAKNAGYLQIRRCLVEGAQTPGGLWWRSGGSQRRGGVSRPRRRGGGGCHRRGLTKGC